MNFRRISFLIFLLLLVIVATAQDNAAYPSFKFDGILKNKFEYATETNKSRFSVRNSRLGISGKITPVVDYRAQVELSNEGKFDVLDLYGSFKPIDGLTLRLGQTGIPIHNSYVTNPGKMMFANRAFIGKYFTPGTRDIGLSGTYKLDLARFPITLDAAVFNGNKSNQPIWSKHLSYSSRLAFGNMKGFRSTVKMYDYPQNDTTHYVFYGIDFRYEADNWKVETEAMHRRNKYDDAKLFSTYLQGAYWLPIRNNRIFKSFMPAARWDAVGNDVFNNGFDVNRATLGLGFGINNQKFLSLLRFDYEWYFVKNSLSFFSKNDEMASDKFTMELVLFF